MNLLRNLSIAIKLSLIPLVAIVGFASYLVFNAITTSQNNEQLELLTQNTIPALSISRENADRVARMQAIYLAVIESGDDENLSLVTSLLSDILSGGEEIAQRLPEHQAELQRLAKILNDYSSQADGWVSGLLSMSLDAQGAENAAQNVSSQHKKLLEGYGQMQQHFSQEVDLQVAEINQTSVSALKLGAVIGGVTLVILVLFAYSIISSTTRNLRQVSGSLKAIAEGEGDLSTRIKSDSDDELGELVKWFNQFISKLQGNVGSFVNDTTQLGDVSTRLQTASENSTSRISNQLQAVVEVSQALEQLGDSVKDIGSNALHASEVALQADQDTNTAGRVVNQSKQTIESLHEEIGNSATIINRLKEDTENITVILDAIKGIADQTNLLALNAAIEAARAGEQGRGFAVVADEVRALASRTQESTHEIQAVIEELQSAATEAVSAMSVGQAKAAQTVECSAEVEQTLNTIQQQVSQILQMNEQIAAAAEQQGQSALEIQHSINGIQQTAENAVDGSQRLAGISKEVADISSGMRTVTDTFKI
ncbi:MAG: methyl-accepting chemotaxis protein [Motiliproteus sp.]